ncbi:hypothetical protein HUU61_10740 [Rhodopseudomonas palustris]|nr:hypothetical protein [Rhodopseudomonas palustris]
MFALARLAARVAAAAMLSVPAVAQAQTAPEAGAAKPKPSAAAQAKPATAADPKVAPKKEPKTMTRRQEIEHAIDTRTVPSRYRSSVPKEYQKYIPFAK